MSNKTVIYIHGKGGNIDEAEHYKTLFQNCDIIGFDYKSQTPWEAKEEFAGFFDKLSKQYKTVILVANSIGAYFAMNSLSDKRIKKAFFISPIVDMKKLIEDMMLYENISENELQRKGKINTSFGQTLSFKYLTYVRENPINWTIPTHILYGEKDNLTSKETITEFAKKINATLTVMENGEHWFHTKEQMNFLDDWIKLWQI
ncbi:MAG: alpha/beta hydrolase [Oscillospiraceae bacterium]|nr:alpha/beta hydrolase [Candidatus Ruminococcus equi]